MRFGCKAALSALVVAAGSLSAQGRLTGTVRDTAGAPIIGAEIVVDGVTGLATTNRSGAFEVRGIKPGPASVTVRRLAYAPQTMVVKIVDGDNNTLPDIVLTMVPRQLDTVLTREQELWRERPLLREMEENRRIGLGQFVTRAELARNQGGFLKQHFNQMRGLVVVTQQGEQSGRFWLGNKYLAFPGYCTELEDNPGAVRLLPPVPGGANCFYCFPTVYLDYSRISSGKTAPNMARFNPDQLEGMEIYLGAAETPMRYSSGFSSCGVIVLHTRAVDSKRRIIAAKQAHPTRSRVYASASVSAGARCFDCNRGPSGDVSLGYTFRDRWVLAGRYATWSNTEGEPQNLRLRQALVEWYPKRDPGRVKWFLNAGLGVMSADMRTLGEDNTQRANNDVRDHYVGSGLKSMVMGTGVDIGLVSRFVLTPFFSYTRTLSGQLDHTRCTNVFLDDGTREWQCFGPVTEPGGYNLRQLGLRFGWR